MNWKKTVLICALVLLAAGGVTALIFRTEPTAERVTATRRTAMLVETVRAERGSFRPTIVALGSVAPEREILLGSRVAGEVVELAPAFTPGGRVEGGETLLRIDPDDFRIALRQRRSDLRRAEADLALEMGRQVVAREDYRLLDEELAAENRSLVLREPQLATARARVEEARAAVARAELDLERTGIAAPFNALVLSREVNLGSQVAPGDPLARLVGLDTYWVEVTVPLAKLGRIAFPDAAGGEGAAVRIRDRAAWPEAVWREGRVSSLVGSLEERTRLARVLVTVPDPLAVGPGDPGRPPLMIGTFVEARIEGEELADVVRLDRDYLRREDTVWVMAEGKLRVREVEVLFRDAEYAYIRRGLEEDERVVVTNLTTVADGAPLRLKEAEGGAAPDAADAQGGGGE